MPYIQDRVREHYAADAERAHAAAEFVGSFSDWARNSERWRCEKARFESKQAGKRGGFDVKWPGVVFVDMMQVVQKAFKMRSYKLDNVAQIKLGERKVDMDPADITPRWYSGPLGAAEVLAYGLWDAELPWRIAQNDLLVEDLVQVRGREFASHRVVGGGSGPGVLGV